MCRLIYSILSFALCRACQYTYTCRYPSLGSSCPDYGAAVNPEAEDEPWHSNPYSMQNYYFPDFSVNNCGHGWDYPSWMGSSAYEKHYLFRDGEDCCSKFFPTASNCPAEHDTQYDYFWTTYEDNISNLDDMPVKFNHTFYPDLNANTCVNGTDFPDWMASDVDYKRLYLFKDLEGCCTRKFCCVVCCTIVSATFSAGSSNSPSPS